MGDIQNNCQHVWLFNQVTLRADCKMLTVVTKNPKMSSQHRQLALATVDVKVHASTIRKRLHKFNFRGRCARKKRFLSKKNMKARRKFARENVDKDQDLWNNVLWTDEYNFELFGHQNRTCLV